MLALRQESPTNCIKEWHLLKEFLTKKFKKIFFDFLFIYDQNIMVFCWAIFKCCECPFNVTQAPIAGKVVLFCISADLSHKFLFCCSVAHEVWDVCLIVPCFTPPEQTNSGQVVLITSIMINHWLPYKLLFAHRKLHFIVKPCKWLLLN